MSDKKIIIAIDGYSSSGKSTMARRLAAEIGYRYIDSGAMYRAVTLYALEHDMIDAEGNIDLEALRTALPSISIDFRPMPDGTQHTLLDGRDVETEIRQLRVSDNVSPIAAVKEVRAALTDMQRTLGRDKGIVMDGRDIGTTVFPQAELKIFVNASAEMRARRRFIEMSDKGEPVNYEEVLANVVRRDHIDETREESPLRRADDAIDLDNSNMTIDEQNAWLDKQYKRVINGE
ncbi:MAG: (d)CMP kinase [Muribaculaceae bacterium]|nr:(d)CMP kinase [Muribaculaceae bacterium]MDE6703612.1 (d)CMP kinase [Muribaculaceae bacterium]